MPTSSKVVKIRIYSGLSAYGRELVRSLRRLVGCGSVVLALADPLARVVQVSVFAWIFALALTNNLN